MSKMAVSRHLGFYRTANSAIRSADLKNPSLEPNMEWIGCTVCEISAFKLHRDLETKVRGHSRSSKVALFDRAHTTLYSSSIVTMPLSSTLSEISPHNGRKLLVFATSLIFGAPVGGEAVRITQRPLVTKNYNDGPIRWWKNFDDTFSRFDTIHACDGQTDRHTDGRNWRGIYAL